MGYLYVLLALALLGSATTKSEEICDCEEKPKCPKGNSSAECPGGRGMLMVPGGPDCSCCEAVCPRLKGERCDEHRLSCVHGLSCNEAGICGEDSQAVELTAISATNTSLTLGWRGPSGYLVQYRESSEGKEPGQWQRLEKLTESPESNITLDELNPGVVYEARALLPGAENDGPAAAVRAETGCECPRPFFRIGSFKDDKFCTERSMPDKPCCAMVICADSQINEEGSTVLPTMMSSSTLTPTTTMTSLQRSAPSEAMNVTEDATPNVNNGTCSYKNETHSMGDVFYDGCEYKCSCGEEGKVMCEPRCMETSHSNSSKCVSLPDPKDACCTIVLCDVTLGELDSTPTQESEQKNATEPTTTAPMHQNDDGTVNCIYNGKAYKPEEEFYDGCKALCACSPTGEVECAPIQCPTDSGLDVLDPHCIDWETIPMEPGLNEGSNPTCCPEVRCRNNGSCEYAGQRFDNFAEIPASVADGCSGHRCFCEFGNVTCGGGGGPTKCPPVPARPPQVLKCKDGGSESAVLAHPPGDNCCLAWVCPEEAHLPPVLGQDEGSTNSSSEGPVPETMMNLRPDEVTISTNNKSRPMTPSIVNITDPTKETVTETNETVTLLEITTPIVEYNMTDDTSQQNIPTTTQVAPSDMDTLQNLTIPTQPDIEIKTENNSEIEIKTENNSGTVFLTTTTTKEPVTQNNMPKTKQTEASTVPQESDKEMTTTVPMMRPIVVENRPIFTSPWGNILNKPQDNGSSSKKFLPLPGPIQMPDEGSMHVETPPSAEKQPESLGIPYAPEYQGPWAVRPTKEPQPTHSFNTIHNTPPEISLGVPHHTIVDENGQHYPIHHLENERLQNTTKSRAKQQPDNTPIFLRYPVQDGKKQKFIPQKNRNPQYPENIPPNINEFQYQGPFLGVPPSGHDDRVVFLPQDERPLPNFPRPIANKNIGSNRQQPPLIRQPNRPIPNIPSGHEGFQGPLLIHHEQGPPSGFGHVPTQVPGHVQRPEIVNGVRQPQNVPSPDQFQIQGLDGEHVPPELAQHILWALQGRPGVNPNQRIPQHPSQRPSQSQRLPPLPPPERGISHGNNRPQEVFFHVPTGIGPGSHPHPGELYIQNQEPPHNRNPPRIPPIPTNQRVSQNQNGQFPPAPPHFLPGVEHSLLPPELYHLAFPPPENPHNRTQGAATSLMDAQPHMTHDHEHLTEDLPLNQHGTELGRPPPPPRFPEVPLHPQLHPPLHNVGSPSDEIVVEAADVLPDSSVHLIFSLPSIFVGLHGQVEISYTEDPLKEDTSTWEGKEIVSTKGDLIENRRLEYTIPAHDGKNGLQPNKNYRIQIALLLRDLRNSPTSRIIKIRTPSRLQDSTTQLPPQIEVDAELGIAEVNATWARFVWRKFNDFELQFIDGVQLRYKEVEGKVYSTTQLLHRATGSYTLEGLRPSSTYEVGLLLVPFPGQKTELIARENLHITTAAEKDPYGFDLNIKVDAVKVFSAEVSWSGVPYPEDKYVNIFRVIYQSDSANTKGGEGSDGADGEERSSTFKVAKRDPSPSALVTGLKPGTRYRMWLEAYLTNGKIKKSDVKDIITKPSSSASTTKQGKLEASVGEVGKKSTEENGDYYGGLVGVSILAALAFVAILVLLLMLLKRQGQAKKAAISTARKSESAYDNPTYKTSDHDSTNGRIKNTVRLQEA